MRWLYNLPEKNIEFAYFYIVVFDTKSHNLCGVWRLHVGSWGRQRQMMFTVSKKTYLGRQKPWRLNVKVSPNWVCFMLVWCSSANWRSSIASLPFSLHSGMNTASWITKCWNKPETCVFCFLLIWLMSDKVNGVGVGVGNPKSLFLLRSRHFGSCQISGAVLG